MLAAVAAPLLLLVVAVGSGATGRAFASDPPAGDPLASDSARIVGIAAAPDGTPPPTIEATPEAGPVAFPPRILGLPTRTVEATLDLRRAGRIGDEIVAVRGWLTIAPAPAECQVQPADLCARPMILADVPDALLVRDSGAVEWGGPRGAVHLHPAALPGVGLPDPGDQALVPFPLIVLGRFDDPRLADPRTSSRHPNEAFALERLAWAVGIHSQVRVVLGVPEVEGRIDARAVRELVSEALPSGTVVLGQALVGIDTVKRLDPTASGLTRGEAERRGLELPEADWYVRVMVRDGLPVDTLAGDTAPRRIGFAVLTVDGTVLAAAIED